MFTEYMLLTFETCPEENSFYVTLEGTKKVQRVVIQECKEIMSGHEEAQVNHLIKNGYNHAEVQSENTDVFCLLLHFYYTQDWITEP